MLAIRWLVAAVLAFAVSIMIALPVRAASVVPSAQPDTIRGLSLATSGNSVSLSADSGSGDVSLVATNATLTVQCACSGIVGQGTSAVTIPAAGNDLSNVTITLAASGGGTPSLTARQGGATAMVSLSTSSTSGGTVTSSGGGSAFASGGSSVSSGGSSVSSGASSVSSGDGTSADADELLPSAGLGLFVFRGGRIEDLPSATGCAPDRLAVWAPDGHGGFVVFVPGALVDIVNAAFEAFFGNDFIPANTPLVGRCG